MKLSNTVATTTEGTTMAAMPMVARHDLLFSAKIKILCSRRHFND